MSAGKKSGVKQPKRPLLYFGMNEMGAENSKRAKPAEVLFSLSVPYMMGELNVLCDCVDCQRPFIYNGGLTPEASYPYIAIPNDCNDHTPLASTITAFCQSMQALELLKQIRALSLLR